MKKISINLSDINYNRLIEIQDSLNYEDQYLIYNKYTITDIINILIERGYQAQQIWNKKPDDTKI